MDKPVRYVFEESGASVQYTLSGGHPTLYVQVTDQYGFQRELTLSQKSDFTSGKMYWEYTIYMHPGRRWFQPVTSLMAERFIKKFLETCEKHPDLLFNPATPDRPRCKGFVELAERLHLKVALNSNLIS